jgi:hypothetical protein
MKSSTRRRLRTLRKTMLPTPEPDMSAWTSMEQLTWAVERFGLDELNRQAHDPDRPPSLPEEWDASDARDAAILARRAAADAAERLEHWPRSAAAQQAVRETREALEKTEKEYAEAMRLAEEARRRPPPPTPVEEKPADAAEASPEAATIDQPAAPPTPEPQPPPEPKPERQWWEERARWRLRGPQDYDWDDEVKLNECIHEYDPLTYDDRD